MGLIQDAKCNLQILLKKVINNYGYDIVASDQVMEKEFTRIYSHCKKFTMTSKERMYSLYKATQYIVNARIPGDFVECGVWSGGSAMIITYTLLEMGDTKRKIYLYDTFEGMTKPGKNDYFLSGKTQYAFAQKYWKKKEKDDHNNWCYAPLSEVKKNIFTTGYPASNIVFIKGRVEDTIPKIIPHKIALLRLDTDFYESTRHELLYLYPLLITKGVILIDDYGAWAGAKKAVDEYFSRVPILLNRVDYTGRIGIKTN